MKRILALILSLIMVMSLTACGGGETLPQTDNNPSNQQQEQPENATDENGRSKATEFTFELAAEEERVVENLVFDEDVTISGDFGIIVFENCEFNGDIINTAEQFTRVILSDETTVNGNCVFKNTTKEATMDSPIPKFITTTTVNVVCEDCIGSCVFDSTGDVVFNGETYAIDDVEFFFDADANELVPYEEQEASTLFVGQWWENGAVQKIFFCE